MSIHQLNEDKDSTQCTFNLNAELLKVMNKHN